MDIGTLSFFRLSNGFGELFVLLIERSVFLVRLLSLLLVGVSLFLSLLC